MVLLFSVQLCGDTNVSGYDGKVVDFNSSRSAKICTIPAGG